MRLQKITISQLEQFITTGEYLRYEVIPITPLRAFSQIRNPKALPDDIVLTLAFTNNELNGFIGALPDRIGDVRCAWNSCWWVKEGTPAEVSLKLFFSFLTDWDKNVLFSELTPHTLKLIESLRFCNHHTIQGFRGYYRCCLADILPRKKPIFRRINTLLLAFDHVANGMILFRDALFRKGINSTHKLLAETIESPTNDLDWFISEFNQKQPTERYSEEFKWIDEYKWVVEKHNAQPKIAENFPFSYAVDRFELHWVKFSIGGELVAIVCYSIRDKELKLQYVFTDKHFVGEVGNYFYDLLKSDKKLCSITTFHPELAAYLSGDKKFIFKTHLPKLTAISKTIYNATSISGFEMQMGDGDCIFT